MNNSQIAAAFSLLAKLMEIHGENSFKIKSYASAAFTIEKLSMSLVDISREKISEIKGLGASSSQKIIELLDTGQLKILEELLESTPSGLIEMLKIKGLGPKKINTIWKEMELENIGELQYACKENRLKLYKGFGEKTQQNVLDIVEFYLQHKGSHLYAKSENSMNATLLLLNNIFGENNVFVTGEFLRQLPVINMFEFVVISSSEEVKSKMKNLAELSFASEDDERVQYVDKNEMTVIIYPVNEEELGSKMLETSSSELFYNEIQSYCKESFKTDREFFEKAKLCYIPPYLREDSSVLTTASKGKLPSLIMPADIRAVIHSHSTWSDGSNSLEEMAVAAIARNLEYLVITDHSKSAFYANGLTEKRIREQHQEIDLLNAKLAPFRIFKGIESDILNDGSLDYSGEILNTFDLVIASVHSNLKMTKVKAMTRLLKAIENPYTTILGHLTGRLLLSREGYPVDHLKIIDACAANQVVIELNANPSRLDMDWRFINYALSKNVVISINPDAHSIKGIDDTRFAVLVAQKAMLTKEENLSSYALPDFEAFLEKTRKLKTLVH